MEKIPVRRVVSSPDIDVLTNVSRVVNSQNFHDINLGAPLTLRRVSLILPLYVHHNEDTSIYKS